MSGLGWGIVGIGRIVQQAIGPAMVDQQECNLVAVVSRKQARSDRYAAEVGASFAYDDYGQMLANPEVDAVYIATPNALHAGQVIAAARAGKHVLCEKPLATNMADAVQAVEACAANKVTLGINFHYRHVPWVNDVKGMIAQGIIGTVRTIHAEAGAGSVPPRGWRDAPRLAGLGTIYSHGVHVFDALRYVLDSDPIECAAMFDTGGYAVETEALVLLRFRNGTLACVDCNQINPHPQNNIAIYGAGGRITGQNVTRLHGAGKVTVLTGGHELVTPYAKPDAHWDSLASYTKSVLRGDQPRATGLDGLHSMVLCDAIARSVTERRVVELDYGELTPFSG